MHFIEHMLGGIHVDADTVIMPDSVLRSGLHGVALEDTAYLTKPTLQNLDESSNLPAPPQLRRAPHDA